MNSVEVYFGEYRKLNGKRMVDANKALQFLQGKIDRSDWLKSRFDEMWLNDGSPAQGKLLFKNVALFYDPQNNPHQFKALEFLNEQLSEETRKEFDRLWFAKPSGFRGDLI
ncbi:MAG TPA: hypothetical protein VLS96_13595 [Nodosilinea sp.]|nr:hypothetical protein [Nodosilinea sp.]